jgi:hypothetical protein
VVKREILLLRLLRLLVLPLGRLEAVVLVEADEDKKRTTATERLG